jgi:hypothetical protein
LREHLPVRGVDPSAKGAVGDESDLVRLALVEHVPPAAVAEVESVLHGGDVSDGSGDGELLERDIGDADVPDLALVLKIFERADRLREGDSPPITNVVWGFVMAACLSRARCYRDTSTGINPLQ